MSNRNPGDYPIPETTTSGTDLARILERVEAARVSNEKGTARPAYLTAGGLWSKENAPNDVDLYLFDGTNDILIGNSVTGFVAAVAVFNAASTYAINDLVARNGDIYKTTAVHNGAWDATHFTALTGDTVVQHPPAGTSQTIQAAAVADVPLTLKGAAGQTGNLQEWQDSTGHVYASMAGISSRFKLEGKGGPARLTLSSYTNASRIFMHGHNGTFAAPTATQAIDDLGAIVPRGYNGTALSGGSSRLDFVAAEDFSSTANGGYMRIMNTPKGKTASDAATDGSFWFNSEGNLGIGHFTDQDAVAEKLHVLGKALIQNDATHQLHIKSQGGNIAALKLEARSAAAAGEYTSVESEYGSVRFAIKQGVAGAQATLMQSNAGGVVVKLGAANVEDAITINRSYTLLTSGWGKGEVFRMDGIKGRVGILQPAPTTELDVNGTISGNALGGGISDAQLKEDVHPLHDGATDIVKALNPVTFEFIHESDIDEPHPPAPPPDYDDPDNPVTDPEPEWNPRLYTALKLPHGMQTGFIAQEVETALGSETFLKDALLDKITEPAVVDSSGSELKAERDILRLNEAKLIPLLVKTIQELTARIEVLESA